jgi:hypothetical protein
MTSLFLVLITAGAVARLTRFAAADHLPLFIWFRRRMLKVPYFKGMFHTDDDGDVWGCGWCISVWVAAVVVPTAYYLGDQDWYLIIASILTASHFTGFLAASEPD